MKRVYKTPLTEVIQAKPADMVMHSNNMADAKENNMFLFDDEEFDDENDLWGEKPNADKYDLWKE